MHKKYPCDISHECMQNIDLSNIVKVVKAIIFVTISVHNHELVNPLISHAVMISVHTPWMEVEPGF